MSKLRLRAITEIHRSKKAGVAGDREKGVKPVPPETEVITPNKLFNAKDQAEFDTLTSGRYPAAVAAPVTGDDTVASEPTAPATTEPNKDDEVALADMTKAQLVAYAKEQGIEVNKKATVPVIRETIEAAENGGSGEDEGQDGDAGGDDGEELV